MKPFHRKFTYIYYNFASFFVVFFLLSLNKLPHIPSFGSSGPMKRAGQPYEIAAIYVYLASDDASYTTGQVIHVNGGEYKG